MLRSLDSLSSEEEEEMIAASSPQQAQTELSTNLPYPPTFHGTLGPQVGAASQTPPAQQAC